VRRIIAFDHVSADGSFADTLIGGMTHDVKIALVENRSLPEGNALLRYELAH